MRQTEPSSFVHFPSIHAGWFQNRGSNSLSDNLYICIVHGLFILYSVHVMYPTSGPPGLHGGRVHFGAKTGASASSRSPSPSHSVELLQVQATPLLRSTLPRIFLLVPTSFVTFSYRHHSLLHRAHFLDTSGPTWAQFRSLFPAFARRQSELALAARRERTPNPAAGRAERMQLFARWASGHDVVEGRHREALGVRRGCLGDGWTRVAGWAGFGRRRWV